MSTPDKLVKVFIKLRDARAALKKEFETADEVLKVQQDTISAALLEHLKVNNAETVRTEAGTFYRTVSTRYYTNDWPAMGEFVVEHNLPDLFEKRLNQGNVAQFLEEHPGVQLPGLQQDASYRINVRKK